MTENRLPDYLDHMNQAASDACDFVEGLSKTDFLADKRTQQAVIMSLIIIGEASTKIIERYQEFTQSHAEVPRRSMRGMRNRIASAHFDSAVAAVDSSSRNLATATAINEPIIVDII